MRTKEEYGVNKKRFPRINLKLIFLEGTKFLFRSTKMCWYLDISVDSDNRKGN
jgi:hypothetical protein